MRNDLLFPYIDFDIPDEKMDHIGGFIPQDLLTSYIKYELEEVVKKKYWNLGKKHFKNEDGTEWLMSPGEYEIFRSVVAREYPRVQITSSTQYGKTITVARGVLERIVNHPEEWLIVVPDLKRGKIMLNYMIKDTYENEFFKDKLIGTDLAERTTLNRLLEEKSKVKLTFQVIDDNNEVRYGSVEIVSCDARRKQDVINSIMGFGGRNVIQEEASLEDDEVDSGIFRMLAGKGEDTFLCKIGNPFYRNHFLTTWRDQRYKKIYIDYKIGLLEGRYVESFIEEAKTKPNFDILFDCKFPREDQIVDGWTPLITETELENALTDDWNPFGILTLGVDPADTGDNESVIVERSRNVARVKFADDKIELIDFCGKIVNAIDEDKIDCRTGAVDKIGVGAMIPGEMKQLGKPIQGVNVGESCDDPKNQVEFINKRAEFAWAVRKWIKGGGKLLRNNHWYQILNIRYREDHKRRLLIMSKEDMRKKNIKSPDAFDALCLSFARPQIFYTKSMEQEHFDRKMKVQQIRKRNKPFKMTGY